MNSDVNNILVTGCGGDIGQSICKILREYSGAKHIVGCDIHNNHPGKFLYDKVHTIPRCSADEYFSSLRSVVEAAEIDFIICSSEPELRVFLANGINKMLFDIPVIMPNLKSLDIGFDKLKTVHFLEECGLPFPLTTVVGDTASPHYPAILKSRTGAGSKQIVKISDQSDFDYYKRKFPDFILQEYIGSEETEYTCGLFRLPTGECRSIIFRRTLSGGFSNFGIVTEDQSISHLLETIAQSLDLNGSINVQLRLTPKGPTVFEINPRFSGTVLFRHLLGFRDLIWSIEGALGLPLSPYTAVPQGKKFYKGYQEYYE